MPGPRYFNIDLGLTAGAVTMGGLLYGGKLYYLVSRLGRM